MKKAKFWPFLLMPLLLISAAGIGGALGLGLALTINTKNTENFTEFKTEFPTRLLDINGEVITEFSNAEKRENIAFKLLPQELIDALLTREDRIFYEHPGFSVKAIIRAILGQVLDKDLGGGSSLTQQIAGTLYCDRSEKSIKRKIKELWWAIQMERRYSKDEILELYLNRIFFGAGCYGVNAACKYYFGHDATSINYAEAAVLVIQLSNPTNMNPFDFPNRARDRQKYVMDAMVQAGYLSEEESEEAFDNFWADFDPTRSSVAALAMRTDRAPWFSEYVRRQLSDMMYGTNDIYTDGYIVNTTLNLSHQAEAEEIMHDYLEYGNKTYQASLSDKRKSYFRSYVPFTELMTLIFNLPGLKVSDERVKILSLAEFTDDINPLIDIVSMISGADTLKTEMVNRGNTLKRKRLEKTVVEGTMISVENSTGYINALVGGSNFDSSNQFIRAVQAKLQPGSSFKPFVYSAAIDYGVINEKRVTMTTVISDTPTVFSKADGSAYIPQNYAGSWRGNVLVSSALSLSLNVPALKILNSVGFDAAIERSSKLLGIPESDLEERGFLPVYPLGLGVVSVSPIEMAKAYSTFANNGKEVVPISIRNIEDRNGNIIVDKEKEVKEQQLAKGKAAQIITEQNAFIMQEMLKKTVASGTLYSGSRFDSTLRKIGKNKGTGYKFRFRNSNGDAFNMPVAGKTGTTQNWADAWAVGFTPYYTSVFWFGFDMPGQSLGLALTGAAIAGPAWGDFMNFIHQGKSYKPFFNSTPSGIVGMNVCADSGELLTEACGNRQIFAYYLKGTEPTTECKVHGNISYRETILDRIRRDQQRTGIGYTGFGNDSPLTIDLDFLNSDTPVLEDDDSLESYFENLHGIDNESDDSDEEDYSFDDNNANWFLD